MKFAFKLAALGVLVLVGLKLLPSGVAMVEQLAAQFQQTVQTVVPPMH